MDGRLIALETIPRMTDGDIETLLAALTRETDRVERVELSFGAVWIKRYGTERPPVWTRLQGGLARLLNQPFLRPSPSLNSKGMIAREIRRIATFAQAGVPVPNVLYSSGSALVLSDVAPTVTARLKVLAKSDPAGHDDLLVACAAHLGALHAKGLCHGRPHPRDFFIAGDAIGFMDFEEEPEAVMPLSIAQARDLWLLFLQVADRALLGRETTDRAFAAWRAAAPAGIDAELAKMLRFLGKFLSPTRLIGRVHMGSDLRRFLAATGYLSEVLSTSPPGRRKQSR
ncbi:serine/threonine protein phosphatase [Shinella sp. CPCC 101442]|uniref:serine/threonine protein phosphatase n=1 Tax=Shinella sp. CPCC 101442 TaxID=2932265 RepID=UPI0021539B3D|nr:serine/threonine protein phosphatase [Shinella sp. CPCC 101442]MCR6500653.1 serine/threonine protein phosphatase [Shinella sp. CPCC 101442]